MKPYTCTLVYEDNTEHLASVKGDIIEPMTIEELELNYLNRYCQMKFQDGEVAEGWIMLNRPEFNGDWYHRYTLLQAHGAKTTFNLIHIKEVRAL